jgi:hypothetical protein
MSKSRPRDGNTKYKGFPSDNTVNAHGLEAVNVPAAHGAYSMFI